jgi:CTP:molybdopterin cytidylyltransferase MocA
MRDWFTLADAARGDEGLRSVLTADGHLVTAVEVGAHPPDVDTPADLAALDAG